MTGKDIPSSGGKKFAIRRNGFEVEMAWVDEVIRHESGDVLFSPDDAVSLGEALTLIGKEAKRAEEGEE